MKKYFVLGVLSLLCFAGCSKEDKTVVVQVGKDKLSFSALQKRFNDAPMTLQGYLNTESGRKQFLDLILRERVVVESARQAGVENRKEYKDTVKVFEEEQKKQFKEYKENLLVEMYVKDIQKKNLNVTEDEVKKYYDDHASDYKKPLEIKARHILLSSKAEAEKVAERLKKGENFANLAKEVSVDPISAGRGGEIGPFSKGDLVPEFEKAVFPLKIGQISDIIETQFGYHIITKISEKVMPSKTYEQAKEEIKRFLEKSKFDAWLEVAKSKLGVKMDATAVKKLAAPQENPVQKEIGK